MSVRSILRPDLWPKVMYDWIENLGNVEDIKDVEVIRDHLGYVSDGGYKLYTSNNCLKLKVTIPPLEHCCTFVQYQGEWMRVDENTDISCAIKHETVAQKQELSDVDAFDLMDSIRDELWK